MSIPIVKSTWIFKGAEGYADRKIEDVIHVRLPYDLYQHDSFLLQRVLRNVSVTDRKMLLTDSTTKCKKIAKVITNENDILSTSQITQEQYLIEHKMTAVKSKTYISSCLVWDELLHREMTQDYMIALQKFIAKERETKEIFPAGPMVLNAFKLTPFHRVCCVIIGSEPSAIEGSSHGLAYSSLGAYRSPSLENIFKEIRDDVYANQRMENLFVSNDLSYWSRQGVLLLNRILTIESKQTEDKKTEGISHKGKGWETFIIEVIKKLNEHPKKLVYLLWGKDAKEMKQYIDGRHLVLEASHPTPKVADKGGWFDKRHFSQANAFINKEIGKTIFWHTNPEKYHI